MGMDTVATTNDNNGKGAVGSYQLVAWRPFLLRTDYHAADFGECLQVLRAVNGILELGGGKVLFDDNTFEHTSLVVIFYTIIVSHNEYGDLMRAIQHQVLDVASKGSSSASKKIRMRLMTTRDDSQEGGAEQLELDLVAAETHLHRDRMSDSYMRELLLRFYLARLTPLQRLFPSHTIGIWHNIRLRISDKGTFIDPPKRIESLFSALQYVVVGMGNQEAAHSSTVAYLDLAPNEGTTMKPDWTSVMLSVQYLGDDIVRKVIHRLERSLISFGLKDVVVVDEGVSDRIAVPQYVEVPRGTSAELDPVLYDMRKLDEALTDTTAKRMKIQKTPEYERWTGIDLFGTEPWAVDLRAFFAAYTPGQILLNANHMKETLERQVYALNIPDAAAGGGKIKTVYEDADEDEDEERERLRTTLLEQVLLKMVREAHDKHKGYQASVWQMRGSTDRSRASLADFSLFFTGLMHVMPHLFVNTVDPVVPSLLGVNDSSTRAPLSIAVMQLVRQSNDVTASVSLRPTIHLLMEDRDPQRISKDESSSSIRSLLATSAALAFIPAFDWQGYRYHTRTIPLLIENQLLAAPLLINVPTDPSKRGGAASNALNTLAAATDAMMDRRMRHVLALSKAVDSDNPMEENTIESALRAYNLGVQKLFVPLDLQARLDTTTATAAIITDGIPMFRPRVIQNAAASETGPARPLVGYTQQIFHPDATADHYAWMILPGGDGASEANQMEIGRVVAPDVRLVSGIVPGLVKTFRQPRSATSDTDAGNALIKAEETLTGTAGTFRTGLDVEALLRILAKMANGESVGLFGTVERSTENMPATLLTMEELKADLQTIVRAIDYLENHYTYVTSSDDALVTKLDEIGLAMQELSEQLIPLYHLVESSTLAGPVLFSKLSDRKKNNGYESDNKTLDAFHGAWILSQEFIKHYTEAYESYQITVVKSTTNDKYMETRFDCRALVPIVLTFKQPGTAATEVVPSLPTVRDLWSRLQQYATGVRGDCFVDWRHAKENRFVEWIIYLADLQFDGLPGIIDLAFAQAWVHKVLGLPKEFWDATTGDPVTGMATLDDIRKEGSMLSPLGGHGPLWDMRLAPQPQMLAPNRWPTAIPLRTLAPGHKTLAWRSVFEEYTLTLSRHTKVSTKSVIKLLDPNAAIPDKSTQRSLSADMRAGWADYLAFINASAAMGRTANAKLATPGDLYKESQLLNDPRLFVYAMRPEELIDFLSQQLPAATIETISRNLPEATAEAIARNRNLPKL